MIIRNLLRFSKTIAKGDTKISIGDTITKQTTFSPISTQILTKIFSISKLPSEFPPPLEVGSAFSELIGNTFPECIYLKQDFEFKRRVRYWDKVDVRVEIMGIKKKEKKLELKTEIRDKEGGVMVGGKSVIIYHKYEEE